MAGWYLDGRVRCGRGDGLGGRCGRGPAHVAYHHRRAAGVVLQARRCTWLSHMSHCRIAKHARVVAGHRICSTQREFCNHTHTTMLRAASRRLVQRLCNATPPPGVLGTLQRAIAGSPTTIDHRFRALHGLKISVGPATPTNGLFDNDWTRACTPPTTQVVITYDVDKVDDFIAIADGIEERFPDVRTNDGVAHDSQCPCPPRRWWCMAKSVRATIAGACLT